MSPIVYAFRIGRWVPGVQRNNGRAHIRWNKGPGRVLVTREGSGAAMADDDHAPTLSAEKARGGRELGVMRYLLHISLALAIIAGILIFVWFRP